MRAYFRAEVRGLDNMPPTGGALLVSNHSGGMLTPRRPGLRPAFYEKFGYTRPLFTLAHYAIFLVPWGPMLPRLGVIHASPDNAIHALRSRCGGAGLPGR